MRVRDGLVRARERLDSAYSRAVVAFHTALQEAPLETQRLEARQALTGLYADRYDRAVHDGFVRKADRALAIVESDPEQLLDRLAAHTPPPPPWWMKDQGW